MRIKLPLKLAALFLGLLAVVVGGLLVAVTSLDLDQIKELLTTQVKTATGRTLTISGPLELQLGLIPSVIASGVTLSNPPGSTRPDMVRIERFEMELSLLPLLHHELVINHLKVSSPDLLIETDTKGPGNLNFGLPPENSGPTNQPSPAPSTTGDGSPYQLILLEVTIENGVVAHYNRATGQTESVELQSLTVHPDKQANELLAVRLAAKAQGRTIEIDGTVGQLAAAIAGKPWPIRLQGAINGLAITAEGSIAQLSAFRGLNLQLTAKGEEVYKWAQLGPIAKPEAPQTIGPFKLSARLNDAAGLYTLTEIEAEAGKRDTLLLTTKGVVKDLAGTMETDLALTMESENMALLSQLAGTEISTPGPIKLAGLLRGSGALWKLSDLKATVAGSDLGGALIVDTTTKRVHLSGNLAANTLHLHDFTGRTVQPGDKPAPQLNPTPQSDGRIFPNQPLSFQALRTIDLDLVIQAGTVTTGNLQLANLATNLHLKDGRLALKSFRTGLAGGKIEGEASLDAAGKVSAAEVHLTARQVELGKLVDHKIINGGKSDLHVNLKGQGESVRALMASLTGETILSVGEGKIQHKAMYWASGDLLFQLMSALNPLAKNEDSTSLSCAAAHFTILDGMATTDKGLAARTDKVDVVGSGTIDLRSERLDLGIRPSPRQGVGLSLSSPISGMTRVRGTLARPAIGIDTEGSLRTAASVGAAAATGGLSMLGEKLFDKISADSDPCRTALGQTQAKPAKGQTAPKTPPQKQGSGGFLQDLFGR